MSINCPFNPNHIMPIERFQNHLLICKATNKDEFAKCKYNTLHVLRKQRMEKHLENCPSRKFCKEDSDDSWGIQEDNSQPKVQKQSKQKQLLIEQSNTKCENNPQKDNYKLDYSNQSTNIWKSKTYQISDFFQDQIDEKNILGTLKQKQQTLKPKKYKKMQVQDIL